MFRTQDGNWDSVGNNIAVFFIRDAIKFPDVIHSLKPDPVTFRQEPNRIFDFMSQTPESMHMLTHLFSPRGIPSDYSPMQGFGLNTYKLVNARGDTVLVKYHSQPKQGVRALTQEQASGIQATDSGMPPRTSWTPSAAATTLSGSFRSRSCPTTSTPIWTSTRSTTRRSGPRTCSRSSPWAAWCSTAASQTTTTRTSRSPSALASSSTLSISPTTRCSSAGPSATRTPSATASVRTTCSSRSTGPAPVRRRTSAAARWNTPSTSARRDRASTHTTSRARWAAYGRRTTRPTTSKGPVIEGRLTRQRIPRTNDYQQAADRYHPMVDWERDDLINNFVDQLGQCDRHVQERMVWHFYLIDDDFGNRVGEGQGMKAADVAHLDPLPKQQLTDEDRQRLSNFGNNPPRELSGKQMTGCLHVMQADEASANGSTNGAAYTASRMQSSRSDG